MHLKREITVGQILATVSFVIAVIGGAYTIRAEVTSLKMDVIQIEEEQIANRSSHAAFETKENVARMATDIRDIRNLLIEAYVAQNKGLRSSRTADGGAISRERVEGWLKRSGDPNAPDNGGTGDSIHARPDSSGANRN